MSILKKLKGDNNPNNMDPKQRSEAVSLAMSELLKKYNCGIDIQHQIVFVPLKEQDETPRGKTK